VSRQSQRPLGRFVGLAAALALTLPAVCAVPSGAAERPAARAESSPLSLWAPSRVVAYSYGRHRVWTDLGLRVIAQGEPFELWSTRASYDEPIHTEWRSAAGTVALPDGVMSDFSGLDRFFTLTIRRTGGGETRTMSRSACLNGWSERVRPDAPATSGYPRSCWYNPYTLGSVQGVQEGWASPLFGRERPLRLERGRYTVTASISPRYASALGLAAEDATRRLTLVVRKQPAGSGGGGRPAHPDSSVAPSVAEPASHEPRGTSGGTSGGRVEGPVPDLRSLPAWGIETSAGGNFLQFSATVWNAGDSPLVVDGFRREGEDEMDAYQYFFDGAGTQTGYEQVGHLHWDPKPSHRHWHFTDFARYTLLDADRTQVVKSHKEAFCLANTDAVDQTVPNADWNPENTDLATSCGDYGSLSIREVLASGWGDTYAQFRAGQSFDLRGLPNGKYFIAVIANPENRLVEASTDNNVALRKVFLGGREDRRTVRVPQVGVIEEPVLTTS
jgi:hypothetical protein